MHSNTSNAGENKLTENPDIRQSQKNDTLQKLALVDDSENVVQKFEKATLQSIGHSKQYNLSVEMKKQFSKGEIQKGFQQDFKSNQGNTSKDPLSKKTQGSNNSKSLAAQNVSSAQKSQSSQELEGEDEKEQDQAECQICAFPYDKHLKIPRIIQCGHTFCQTCLVELRQQRGPDQMCISCPNCRKVTQVMSLDSLPENEYVFKREPHMFTMNIFSPYEAAKRLGIETKSLVKTGERYLQYLMGLQDLDKQYEDDIIKNYEQEHEKIESFKNIMIKIICDYSETVKEQLLQQMLHQRTQISDNTKEINEKINGIQQIIQGVDNVEHKLQQIVQNEQAYLHKQMQQYYNQVDIEESINFRNYSQMQYDDDVACNPSQQQNDIKDQYEDIHSQNSSQDKLSNSNNSQGNMMADDDIKKKCPTYFKGCMPKSQQQPLKSLDFDSKAQVSQDDPDKKERADSTPNSSRHDMQFPNHYTQSFMNTSSSIQNRQDLHILSQIESLDNNDRRGDEYISMENFDKLLLQDIRTEFYKFNTEFEQILKFKPIRKIQISHIELNLDKAYQSLQSLSIEDRIHSFEDQIRKMELELDLKDYYDIKRPTVVFFSNGSQSSSQLNITRYDILSETYHSSEIKFNSLGRFNPQKWNNGLGWTALSHPSNNSIFLINGADIFLFDNQNELMLKKQSYPANEYLTNQAICYSEGFIYFLGGFCQKENKHKRQCTRYNIVTEKWQKISPMIFAKENAAACSINEYQIIVAGGKTAGGNLTDIVEIYDLRENTWKVFSHSISSQRQQMTIICALKDRAIIIGGKDKDGRELNIVEEIDFLKVQNSCVTLETMKEPRTMPNAFLVNDSIYVISRQSMGIQKNKNMAGEKYELKENKWKAFQAKNTILSAPLSVTLKANTGKVESKQYMVNYGPAALLYE